MHDFQQLLKIFTQKATPKKTYRLMNRDNVENKNEIKEIIDGCIAKKRKAQEELFKLFYGKMMGVCLRYHRDKDDAQEILQLGFIKVFDKLEGFDYKGSFEGWMRRIIANTAIDSLRKAKKNPLLTDNDEDFKLGTENPIVEKEEAESLHIQAEIAMDAIQQLSPAYRAVFNLYVMEEYTHKEIAEIQPLHPSSNPFNNLASDPGNILKFGIFRLSNKL